MKNLLYPLSAGALLSVVLASQPVAAGTDNDAETTEAEKSDEIVDRRHPDYVRCRLEPVIGSLAKKRRVCMTNEQWAAHIEEGNKRSKQFVADMDGGMRTDVP